MGAGHTIKLWDSRPWTVALRTEQRALAADRNLVADQALTLKAVLERTPHDRFLSPAEREKALEFAQKWRIADPAESQDF